MGFDSAISWTSQGLHLLKRWDLRSITVLTCFGASNIPVLDPAIVTGMEVSQSKKSHLSGGKRLRWIFFFDTEHGPYSKTRWWFQICFFVHPYLGGWSNLTNIFQMGWNHQLDIYFYIISQNHPWDDSDLPQASGWFRLFKEKSYLQVSPARG